MLRRDRRPGIRRRQNIVAFVTAPATRRRFEPERGNLPVEGIPVTPQPLFVAIAACCHSPRLPGGRLNSCDSMNRVAISANWRGGATGLERFSMHSFEVEHFNIGVARATTSRNVLPIGLAIRVLRAQDTMRPVATDTICSDQQAVLRQSEAMD